MNLSNRVRGKYFFVGLLFLSSVFCLCSPAYALATPHHLYNISRRLVEVVGAPFYAIFYEGPRRMKKVWNEEMQGAEKPKHRGRPVNLLSAVPRAVGEETKAGVDGVTRSVDSAGKAAKEVVSIFLGD